MDIAALSIVMSQAKVQQDAGVSLLRMAMQNASRNGEDFAQMLESTARVMEQSVQPYIGKNIDVSI